MTLYVNCFVAGEGLIQALHTYFPNIILAEKLFVLEITPDEIILTSKKMEQDSDPSHLELKCTKRTNQIKVILDAKDLNIEHNNQISGPEVIKLFSCSSQLSTKFQLLIKTKKPTNKDVYYMFGG